MDGNYSLADIAAATGNGRNNDGMFGGDGSWWIIVLFIFAFFGWGNNGWGNNGNGGGYAATAATQADIQRGFDNSAVISKLDGINSGLCDGFYAMNNGMLTGFNGINTNIMQTGFGIQQAINADTVANMQNTNALQAYYNTVLDEMRGGGYNDDYSERGRKRDSMGRYSSNDGRMMPDYDRGSSYARRGEHYVRGHYSRSDGRDAYDDYMTQKQSYRSGKSEDCKRKMLAALEEHLDELTTEMSDMSKDAECREERDLVKRYVEKLRDML